MTCEQCINHGMTCEELGDNVIMKKDVNLDPSRPLGNHIEAILFNQTLADCEVRNERNT